MRDYRTRSGVAGLGQIQGRHEQDDQNSAEPDQRFFNSVICLCVHAPHHRLSAASPLKRGCRNLVPPRVSTAERASNAIDQGVMSLHNVDGGHGHHHGMIVAARIERPISGWITVWRENEQWAQDAPPMPPAAPGRSRKHRQKQVEDLGSRHRSRDENQIAKCRSKRGQTAHDNQADLISLSHTARAPIKSDGLDYSGIISQRLAISSISAWVATRASSGARLGLFMLGEAFFDGSADECGPAVFARYGLNPGQHRSFQPENCPHRLVVAVERRASHARATIRYIFFRKSWLGAAGQRGEKR